MMSVDRPTGETIARLMAHLRPEWDLPGCIAAVRSVARKHPADVAMAAVRLAANPDAKTPGALSVPDGQHWREKVALLEPPRPPRRGEDCPNHPGQWIEACAGCRSDYLAGDKTIGNPRRMPVDTEALAAARAAIEAAKARLCSHGVELAWCKDRSHETEPEEEGA